jgi:hypothetical protein
MGRNVSHAKHSHIKCAEFLDMYNKNEVLTIKTSKVKIKKTAYSLLSVKGMPTIAFVMAASLCTMLPANAGEVRSNSMKLGYSGSAKTYVITRKNIKTCCKIGLSRAGPFYLHAKRIWTYFDLLCQVTVVEAAGQRTWPFFTAVKPSA